jgi:hypothetical protein
MVHNKFPSTDNCEDQNRDLDNAIMNELKRLFKLATGHLSLPKCLRKRFIQTIPHFSQMSFWPSSALLMSFIVIFTSHAEKIVFLSEKQGSKNRKPAVS